jgi:hypothetical protein
MQESQTSHFVASSEQFAPEFGQYGGVGFR